MPQGAHHLGAPRMVPPGEAKPVALPQPMGDAARSRPAPVPGLPALSLAAERPDRDPSHPVVPHVEGRAGSRLRDAPNGQTASGRQTAPRPAPGPADPDPLIAAR